MIDDLKVFRELILWLWDAHEKPWDYGNDQARLIAEKSGSQTASFYTAGELEAYLPSQDKVDASFPENRFFYLTPITDQQIIVPRIRLKCDFGRNIPEIRCRLELFLLNEHLQLRSLGYRFESPEGKNDQGSGIHHYYHIQLIQPPTYPAGIPWLPETQPAFPINADNPVRLILSLLISLYGLGYLATILNESNVWMLNEYITDFPCIMFESFHWYRTIEIGDQKHIEPYEIVSDLDDFETHIRRKYQGCTIRGITRFKFDGFNKSKQKKYP